MIARLVFALALLLPTAAEACSVCYCGDPTLLPLGILQPESGQLRLSFDGSFLQKETGPSSLSKDLTLRHLGSDGIERESEWRLMMTGSFTLRDTTLSMVVPWVSTSLTEQTGAAISSSSLSGPGDIELYAKQQWFLNHRISKIRHIAGLSAGVKLPTGERGDEAHLSPGTGSLDGLLGVSYTYDADPFSIYTSVLGRYNGERDGVQYGSSLFANVAARYRLNDYVLLAAQLNARLTAKDQEGGVEDPDSGGAIVFVSPQVVVRPKGTWALRASVQVPLVDMLYGAQEESAVFQTGVSYDL